ncbi:hypothetical protein [Cerasicoccus arenae]|uniref:hypothetical protein n=1 Tax=Cerasicoccus arenae TaxID=424488 RepID=UPI00167A5710|nr:hypothetical protein [Cerasicoccus arenae]MBK1859710.1 hypothetical protein [Cerasicoccus arenae]
MSKNTPFTVAEPSHALRVSARGDHAHKTYLVFDLGELGHREVAKIRAAKLSLTTLESHYLIGYASGTVSLSVYGVKSVVNDPNLAKITWEDAPANDIASPSLVLDGKAELLATLEIDTGSLSGEEVLQWTDERLVSFIQRIGYDSDDAMYLMLVIVSDGMVQDPGINFYSNKGTSLSEREPKLVLSP